MSNMYYNELTELSEKCNEINNSYWKLHYKLKKYDLMIMIPCIVVSGLTSVSAIAQLIGGNLAIQIITIILSLIVTILASVHKYIEFDKRSIIAKQVAKRWGSVKGNVDFFILSSDAIKDQPSLLIIIHSIFNNIDSIGASLEDVPDVVLSNTINNIRGLIINK